MTALLLQLPRVHNVIHTDKADEAGKADKVGKADRADKADKVGKADEANSIQK